jgi:hypothetical protein
MRLLTAHKILIGAAISLGVILTVWGAVHAVGRGESQGWGPFALGVVVTPAAVLYLRKLVRNPPIR